MVKNKLFSKSKFERFFFTEGQNNFRTKKPFHECMVHLVEDYVQGKWRVYPTEYTIGQ